MKHELNMIDYLDEIEHDTTICEASGFNLIMDKKNFLKSQPKLGDFVPTNEKGEPLEKPSEIASFGQFEYQSALDRVLWKGWEVKWRKKIFAMQTPLLDHSKDGYIMLLIYKENRYTWNQIEIFPTYNDLITSGIKLERIQRK